MDGHELINYEDDFIKFIKILYKDNLESHHLIKFINDKIFSNTKKNNVLNDFINNR
jgi:hypothetical protein